MTTQLKYERKRLQSAFRKGVKEGRRLEREDNRSGDTTGDAAKRLLDLIDGDASPDIRRFALATSFAVAAYEAAIDMDSGGYAMARSFLLAFIDPASPDLDYLRARYQLADDTPEAGRAPTSSKGAAA